METPQEHQLATSIRLHNRPKEPVHQVIANMSVEVGNVLAVLTNSQAREGYPYAMRVFRVDEDGHEVHINTILTTDIETARVTLAETHGIAAFANLTSEMARQWKETYRLGAPLPLVDLPTLLMNTFCAIRDNQNGTLSDAETNVYADALRTALGLPRWGVGEDFPSLDLPHGIQTPYGPVYGQPEAIAHIRELMNKEG